MPYEMASNGLSIKCFLCGTISFNIVDVRNRYCARCSVFHDEYSAVGMDAFRPKESFCHGDVVESEGRLYEVVENEGLHGRANDEDGHEVYPFFWFREGAWCRRVHKEVVLA